MKIKKIIYILILSVMLIALVNPTPCFALGPNKNNANMDDASGGEMDTPVAGNSDMGLPALNATYKPTPSLGSASSMVSTVLSVLIVLGIVATVIGIALIGFGAILGSAGEKADAQAKMIGIVVAGVLITGGCGIAKMLISMAEKI